MMTTTMGGAGRRRERGVSMGWPIERMARMAAAASAIFLQWAERRRQRKDLASLTDAMLKDIGITRADVWQELNKPFWRE